MLRWILVAAVLGGLAWGGVKFAGAYWTNEARKPFDPSTVEKRYSVEFEDERGFRNISGTEAELMEMMDPKWEQPDHRPPAGSRYFTRKISDTSSQSRIIPPGRPIPEEPGWVEIPYVPPPPPKKDSPEVITRRINAIARVLKRPLPAGIEAEPPPKSIRDTVWGRDPLGGTIPPQPGEDVAAVPKGAPGLSKPGTAEMAAVPLVNQEKRPSKMQWLKQAPPRVGTKSLGWRTLSGRTEIMEADLGPSITLQIPPKPMDPLEAFYFNQTVGELLRKRNGPAKSRDQKAIDLFVRWSRMRAHQGSASSVELCLMWHDVEWLQPIADHIYERNERRVIPVSSMFMMGLRFKSTTESLEKAGYSPYLQFIANIAAANEIVNYLHDDEEALAEARRYADKAVGLLPAVLTDPDLVAGALESELDNLCQLHGILSKDPEPETMRILDTIGAKRPEMVPLLKGSLMICLAWHARGSGYANTITEEGGRLFESRLKKARVSLMEAWEKEPSVEVALNMMSVCLGQSEEREIEVWYNRAINLCPDSVEARSRRLQSLCAKWFGSDAEMYAFARECVERYRKDPTLNYEGALLICDAHREAGMRAGDLDGILSRREVYAEIKDVLELIVQRNPRALDVWSRLAKYADIAGDFKTAYKAFKKLEPPEMQCTVGFQSMAEWQSVRARAMERGKP